MIVIHDGIAYDVFRFEVAAVLGGVYKGIIEVKDVDQIVIEKDDNVRIVNEDLVECKSIYHHGSTHTFAGKMADESYQCRFCKDTGWVKKNFIFERLNNDN